MPQWHYQVACNSKKLFPFVEISSEHIRKMTRSLLTWLSIHVLHVSHFFVILAVAEHTRWPILFSRIGIVSQPELSCHGDRFPFLCMVYHHQMSAIPINTQMVVFQIWLLLGILTTHWQLNAVTTTTHIREGTAAIVAVQHLATCRVIRARWLVVRTRMGPPDSRCCCCYHRDDWGGVDCLVDTGLLGQVTLGAMGTAVLVVVTAYRLGWQIYP